MAVVLPVTLVAVTTGCGAGAELGHRYRGEGGRAGGWLSAVMCRWRR